ncbi:MAG: ATP synthase F1 subunit epsilon [Bifidobacteriaceae bacterium]|jgi:F-type H+-transporting ATPase subunit epsilon|nr:ATP synthase F1 subunit epsilon [Bifidobacteriaceae bacterium]
MVNNTENTPHIMQYDFVSPAGKIMDGKCVQVIAPSVEGEIGILYDHEPILTALKEGQVRISDEKVVHKVEITGGFLSVDSNEITIVADSAKVL